MKKLITCLILITGSISAYSQSCQVTTSASSQVVCLGNPVTISATATATLPANQFFNFNQNQLPSGWSTTGGTSYNANTCGQSPDGTPYFWASTVTSGLPQIVTADFDICSGGNLSFQMRYAVQGGASPCEGPDLRREGVSIEYSLNSGLTWVEFRYYQPDGQVLNANPGGTNSVATGPTPFTVWSTFTVPIPPAAISSHTRFRWIQKFSSGGCCDNWGLDNIGILAGPCLSTNLVWDNGMSGVGNFTFTPTADTCFVAALYDDNNNFLCESSPVCIQIASPYTVSTSATICNGASYTIGTSSFTTPGQHTATLHSVQGCDSIVTVNLTVLPPNSTSLAVDICGGQTYTLGNQTYAASGTYQHIFSAANGCDSTVNLALTVHPVYATTKDTSFCDGFVYQFGGQTFTQAGSFPIHFTSIYGCDSLVTVNVTILPAPVPVAGNDLVLCSGQVGNIGGAPISNAVYTWSGGSGIADATASQTTVSVTSLVPQYLTYVVSSDYFGCIASDTVNVAVIPYPVVSIPSVAPQCLQGNVFNFTPGSGFMPNATFAWNMAQGNPTNSAVQNPSGVSFVTPGTHQVNVTVSHGACSTSDAISVVIYPEPEAQMVPLPPNGCIPLTVNFQNTSIPANVTSQWAFGNGNFSTNNSPTTTYGQPGTYTVSLVVTSPEGCVDTTIFNSAVTAFPLPIAGFSASPTTVFQDDPYIQILDNSSGSTQWAYTISSGGYYETQHVYHQFYGLGQHHIHQLVTNQYGCTATAEMSVDVFPATTLYFPNAFTPNSDDLNTYFGAVGNYVTDFHMTIYDRWGMKVFESRDMNHRWDGTNHGKLIKSDTYVYRVTYVNHRGDTKEQMGHVTMIR